MIRLNDNNLIVGEIKQLLHTFNLPQCQIGSAYPKPNTNFLVRDHIMRWNKDLSVEQSEKYVYGEEYLNLTATLPIRNMIYDRETHRYLGKYLRFLRDYSGVDLMSMYNCCDGDINTQKLKFTLNPESPRPKDVSFKSGDDNCTVYKVPVSINSFTISSHSSHVVEVCVYLENSNDENQDMIRSIARNTYKKRKIYKYFRYSPFESITDPKISEFILEHVQDLYILVKISDKLNTSLVVLEGDYIDGIRYQQDYYLYKPTLLLNTDEANTSLLATIGKSIQAAREDKAYIIQDTQNWIANIRANDGELLLVAPASRIKEGATIDSGYQISAQLLSLENTNGGYLLADRLIEYLTGNAVNPTSDYYDIKRVQAALNALRPTNGTPQSKQAIFSNYRKLYGDVVRRRNPPKVSETEDGRYLGIWHVSDLQDLRCIAHKSGATLNYDTLGYLDKDLEEVLKGVLDNVEI